MRQALFQCVVCAVLFAAAVPSGAEEYRLLELDGMKLKWGAPVLGTGAEVSYGFATADAAFPDAINCRALAPMAELARAWRGDPARLERVAGQAFGMWSRAADVTFREAGPGEAPDILIGAQGEPEGVAFANVWRGPGADGVAALARASVCLNPEVAWTTDDGPTPPGVYDLATVLAHEIGHAIGLDHPGAHGALMAYAEPGPHDALMPGDVAGAVRLYGPRPAGKESRSRNAGGSLR